METPFKTLKSELKVELQEGILPFWLELEDEQYGGFYGRVDGNNVLHKDAVKGAIYLSRILWTFSAAYRILGNERYKKAAHRAMRFIIDKMIDPTNGGVYWSVSPEGEVVDSKKQIYTQGFAIYGLSEYYRATADCEALDHAVQLFEVIEKYAYDTHNMGYLEAFTHDWQPIDDMRLSDKDDNEPKTMNTHLHILEPYTNLYRAWPNDRLKARLGGLVEIFMGEIIDKNSHHCGLFFDLEWHCKSNTVSFGHDIEAFWLLYDAIETLDDQVLRDKYTVQIPRIAEAALRGIAPDASMLYDKDCTTGKVDAERHWWVQAENVVGCSYLYRHYGNNDALQKAINGWKYIKTHLKDTTNGEWYWSILENGTINTTDDKAGFWKCPYHNGRMCLEIISL